MVSSQEIYLYFVSRSRKENRSDFKHDTAHALVYITKALAVFMGRSGFETITCTKDTHGPWIKEINILDLQVESTQIMNSTHEMIKPELPFWIEIHLKSVWQAFKHLSQTQLSALFHSKSLVWIQKRQGDIYTDEDMKRDVEALDLYRKYCNALQTIIDTNIYKEQRNIENLIVDDDEVLIVGDKSDEGIINNNESNENNCLDSIVVVNCHKEEKEEDDGYLTID